MSCAAGVLSLLEGIGWKDSPAIAVLAIMGRKRTSIVSPVPDLIDSLLDGYVTWREQSAAVEAAYRSWRAAPRGQRAAAFDSYSAALDREEAAASEYRRLVELAEAA